MAGGSPRSGTPLSRFLDQEVFLSRICHMYTHAQMVLGHALIWVLFYRLASGYNRARSMHTIQCKAAGRAGGRRRAPARARVWAVWRPLRVSRARARTGLRRLTPLWRGRALFYKFTFVRVPGTVLFRFYSMSIEINRFEAAVAPIRREPARQCRERCR